jgi:transglutaminase-like putative cysteine protease
MRAAMLCCRWLTITIPWFGAALTAQDSAALGCVLAYEVTAGAETKSLRLQVVLPDTVDGRQQVKSTTFSVPPREEVRVDGVRYAIWELSPVPASTRFEVNMQLELRAPASARPPKAKTAATEFEREPWLLAEPFVDVADPAIVAAAKKLGGKGDEELARKAAKFVGETLKYGGFQEQAQGAAAALQSRTGDCTEFSDLMIALLRARGVPARHVTGFVTDWTDTAKHSWVEVHLGKRGWVLFDPTLARLEPERLSGPRPTYVMLSTLRHDPRLENKNWFHYRFTGGAAKVTGTVTLKQGKSERSCPL